MESKYIEFVWRRITDLRIAKNVSEHRMSLDLDKSGSYIRGITSGAALPSLKELFNIMDYFDITPVEFFVPLEKTDTEFSKLCAKLRMLGDEDLEKVNIFLSWIEKVWKRKRPEHIVQVFCVYNT